MNISPEKKHEAKYPRMLTATIVTAAAAAVASCQQQREPQGLMGVGMSEIIQRQTRWENMFYHRPKSEDNTEKAPDVQSDR